MKRVFNLIIICAIASTGASVALAQSRRIVRRVEPPKEERTAEEKSERTNEAKDEANDAAKDRSRVESRTDDEVFTSKEVTERAVIKSRPLPGYPHGARPHGVEGRVKLRLVLGADGKIHDEIEVLEGLPYGVTEEAIKAARRIEFEPAQKDGRPVSQYVTVIYNFNLY